MQSTQTLILLILTFVFDKLDHIVNSKNCYGSFRCELNNRKIKEKTLEGL